MSKDIAVCIGENGETATLYDKGKIAVYRKKRGIWSVIKEEKYFSFSGLGMQELRGKMAELIGFLNGCRVFVGLSVTGVPYFELRKSLFSIWETVGKPVEFLDYVLQKEEEAPEPEQEKKGIQLAPIEVFKGCYRISLKEIQEKNTGVTSKQALLPFLRQGDFHSLEVLCSHVPPWLEAELTTGKLSGTVEKIRNNELKVTITR